MKQCNQMGPHGKCTRSWKRRFGVTKTNCTQFGLTHVFNVPEQAPNMPHTDKDEDKDEDGDLTMEDRMTTRSNSQTTGTSPVGSATDMVRDPSRHNDYQQMYEDGMAYWNGMNFKERDKKHGQSMIEASASSGYPMAVAYCHYQGWNGMEEDEKKAEEESNSGGGSSSSSSSSSSFSVGSKRGRSSSSSSSCSSGTSKLQKKDDTSMAEHDFSVTFWVGQWLYEEGMAYWHGLKFKKKDKKRSRLMIEASASSGFPMAVAGCHYSGWNGMEQDLKKAFEMFVKIEQDTSGYHWVQCFLSECYQYGKGTDQDYTKAVESYTKSSEHENSVAMCHLGFCNEKGQGCDQNYTKAVEWYEKSANLGNSAAMYNLGKFYKNGRGVTKDLNKAREWFTKAAAQGSADAQTQLDRLNASNN